MTSKTNAEKLAEAIANENPDYLRWWFASEADKMVAAGMRQDRVYRAMLIAAYEIAQEDSRELYETFVLESADTLGSYNAWLNQEIDKMLVEQDNQNEQGENNAGP